MRTWPIPPANVLLFRLLPKYFSEILFKIQNFSFEKINWKILYAKVSQFIQPKCRSHFTDGQEFGKGFQGASSSWYTLTSWPLTHWGHNKMVAILQMTFSNWLSWMKPGVFLFKFHWVLFLMVQLTINHQCLRQWLGADQVTSHYLSHWWPCSMTHICVTLPQWVSQYLCFIILFIWSHGGTALTHWGLEMHI